jgi:predicted enzyme related to lactoylglutathione lyase
MKRFHVHVAVDDIQKNIRFYSALFHADPAVVLPAVPGPVRSAISSKHLDAVRNLYHGRITGNVGQMSPRH